MLDPWIIEEIIRREREEQSRKDEQRRIELPLNPPRYHDSEPARPAPPPEDKDRGVTVIDI
jgi:hypothetical protein